MLSWRVGLSCVLIPALLALFRWDIALGDNALVLLVLCLLLTLRATFELTDLLKTRNLQPAFELCAAINVAVILAAWTHRQMNLSDGTRESLLVSLGLVGGALVSGFVVLLMREAARYQKPGHAMESLGANMITVLYAGGLLATIAQLRWFPAPQMGYFVIGSVIIAVKAGDTMAYTFGRLWGKRKMIPRLSPGKTWIGGLGALVGSGLGGWLWLTFGGGLFDAAPRPTSLSAVLAYSVTLGVVGLIGDLCESLIKRDAEKKDSAKLMPGFGGLLDLLDSPLFAAPFAVAWWALWPPAA